MWSQALNKECAPSLTRHTSHLQEISSYIRAIPVVGPDVIPVSGYTFLCGLVEKQRLTNTRENA